MASEKAKNRVEKKIVLRFYSNVFPKQRSYEKRLILIWENIEKFLEIFKDLRIKSYINLKGGSRKLNVLKYMDNQVESYTLSKNFPK